MKSLFVFVALACLAVIQVNRMQRQEDRFEEAIQGEVDRGQMTETEARRYWADVREKHPERFSY